MQWLTQEFHINRIMQNTNENFSFKKYAWTQFKKNKIALVSLYLLFALILIALFAPYIANDRPLYAKYEGKHFIQHSLVKQELILFIMLKVILCKYYNMILRIGDN